MPTIVYFPGGCESYDTPGAAAERAARLVVLSEQNVAVADAVEPPPAWWDLGRDAPARAEDLVALVAAAAESAFLFVRTMPHTEAWRVIARAAISAFPELAAMQGRVHQVELRNAVFKADAAEAEERAAQLRLELDQVAALLPDALRPAGAGGEAR